MRKKLSFWKITLSLGVIDLFHFELLWVLKQYFLRRRKVFAHVYISSFKSMEFCHFLL